MAQSGWNRPIVAPILVALGGLLAGALVMWLWPPSRPIRQPVSFTTMPGTEPRDRRGDAEVSGAALPGFRSAGPLRENLSVNPLYGHEFSMRGWAGANADWEPVAFAAERIKSRHVMLHRALFAGDFSSEIPVRRIRGPGAEFGAVLWPGNQIGDVHVGYHLRLTFDTWNEKNDVTDSDLSGDTVSLNLFRNGRLVAARELEAPRRVSRLLVRRAGRQILVGLNGKIVLLFRDDEPIETRRFGYYRAGVETIDEQARAEGEGVTVDLFDRSPAAWVAIGAHWKISPRWICDPRWTFMTGGNYKNEAEKLSAVWSKHEFGPDVAVEFHVGIRMDAQRRVNGNYYASGRDINVTLCADGTDLSSGYTLSFGGHDGQLTGIYRRGKLVRRAPGVTMPRTMRIHNRWFRIRAERIGRRVRFQVHAYRTRADLTFDDPEPLQGRRVAIWTYDNGIVVSRVRISGQRTGPGVSPDDLSASTPKTFYDLEGSPTAP